MLNKYTVEFTLKYHKNRHISDATLNEFLSKAKARSKEFKEHQYPIGFDNNRQKGYVHFYSDADFLGIYRIAENFAKGKNYAFTVKQERYKMIAKNGGTIASAGGFWNFLNTRYTFKELFTK